MSPSRTIIQRVQRRLNARRATLTACQMALGALAVILTPLVLSRIMVHSADINIGAIIASTAIAGVGIFAAIALSQAAVPEDAAKLIDQAESTGSLFLTSLDASSSRRSALFHVAFEARLEAAAASIDPVAIVPLTLLRTPVRALLILTCVVGSVALVPAASSDAPPTVRRVHDYLIDHTDPETLVAVTPEELETLLQSRTPEEMKAQADEIWKHENLQTDAERSALIKQLRDALTRQDRREISELLNDPQTASALADADQTVRSELADLISDFDKSARGSTAADALKQGDASAAATALAQGAEASAVDTSRRDDPLQQDAEPAVRRRELRQILLTVYAQLGSAPPAEGDRASALDETSRDGSSTNRAALPFNADRYSRADRAILANYFERRRWTSKRK